MKALSRPRIYEICTPFVIGDREAMQEALDIAGQTELRLNIIRSPEEVSGTYGVIDLYDMHFLSHRGWEYKKVSELTGEASFQYVAKSIEMAKQGTIHGVVTGPINKEAINLAGHHYSGHTEIFAELTGTKNYAMLLCSDQLHVIHVTTHVSMRDACDRVTKERVLTVIRLADEAMRLLGYSNVRIGVAGLNAHASENGLFGREETDWIIPAIDQARREGLNVDGPVPPDTVFVKALANQYDIIVAMYHDQGHIPLKLSGFRLDPATNRYASMSGVNTTVGLPVIRTSVDHGTAFGKAGENRANEQSMVEAIEMAATMATHKFHLA